MTASIQNLRSVTQGIANIQIAAGTPGVSSSAQRNPASSPQQVQAASSAYPVFNVDELLAKKLADPSLKLHSAESIALLTHCINLGKVEATKANTKDLIVFIGNTGAGKSTFVNYLYGCKMKREQPKNVGITGTGKIIIVHPDSPHREIMPIGHDRVSKTFMPQIEPDPKQKEFTYCDCPGFLDNRGAEINIANAVNIKNAFIQARSVKVVMLINYHSLKADRGRGLTDMINICCSLFGSKENLIKYKNSILLGVTQIPLASVKEDDEEDQSIDDLKKWMAAEKFKNDFEKNAYQSLSEQLFLYDPLDNKKLEYTGSLVRDQIVTALTHLEPITNPLDIFKTVLTADDLQGLVTIANDIKAAIISIFNKQALNAEDFKQIAAYQESLHQLEIIEHPYVSRLTADTRHIITQYFQQLVHQFEIHCVDTSADLTAQSEFILKTIKEGIQHFDAQVQAHINTAALDERYNRLVLKHEAKRELQRIDSMERTFYTCLRLTEFDKAEALLSEIEQGVKNYGTKYAQLGDAPKAQVKEMKTLLTTSKKNHETELAQRKEQQHKLQELEKKLRRETQERERIQKEHQEQLAREKREREEEARLRQLAQEEFKHLQQEANAAAQQKIELLEREEKEFKQKLESDTLALRTYNNQFTAIFQKQILRDQLIGNGPVQTMMTPQGSVLINLFGQCYRIVWFLTPDQVVIQVGAGFYLINKEGATPVTMTPQGPMPAE